MPEAEALGVPSMYAIRMLKLTGGRLCLPAKMAQPVNQHEGIIADSTRRCQKLRPQHGGAATASPLTQASFNPQIGKPNERREFLCDQRHPEVEIPCIFLGVTLSGLLVESTCLKDGVVSHTDNHC